MLAASTLRESAVNMEAPDDVIPEHGFVETHRRNNLRATDIFCFTAMR
jgi:hypothetical protein